MTNASGGRDGKLQYQRFSKYLEVALRKFVRFFPTYQNYLNVCGYTGSGRKRCDIYKKAGKRMVKPFIKQGYLLAIVSNIYAGLKPAKYEKPSWWRIDKHVTNYFNPMRRITDAVGTLRDDLRDGKCTKDIEHGMKEIFKSVIVDLLFKYAAAETEADKMILENDAADFFTGKHVDHEEENVQEENVQEHLAFKKIIRQLTLALSKHLGEGTITLKNRKGPNQDSSLPETKSPPERNIDEVLDSRGTYGGRDASIAGTTISQKPKGKIKKLMAQKGSKSYRI